MMVRYPKRAALVAGFFAVAFLVKADAEEAAQPRALIVVGPSNHPPGSHEPAAGARLMKYCLETMQNHEPIEADVLSAWPVDGSQLERYRTVVLIGDQFPGERLDGSAQVMQKLSEMMARGCGMVCVHYGTGLTNEDVARDGDHPLLHWTGGYFATRCDHHQSVARIYRAAKVEPADTDHPIARGWKPFELHDEPYINNYFGPDDNRMLSGAFAVATSLLPPDRPQREVIAWGIERKDGGRGFGVTLPHFYKNWQLDPLRTFILNGIVWTAKQEVPAGGVQTTLPDLSTFKPAAVEFRPRNRPKPPVNPDRGDQ